MDVAATAADQGGQVLVICAPGALDSQWKLLKDESETLPTTRPGQTPLGKALLRSQGPHGEPSPEALKRIGIKYLAGMRSLLDAAASLHTATAPNLLVVLDVDAFERDHDGVTPALAGLLAAATTPRRNQSRGPRRSAESAEAAESHHEPDAGEEQGEAGNARSGGTRDDGGDDSRRGEGGRGDVHDDDEGGPRVAAHLIATSLEPFSDTEALPTEARPSPQDAMEQAAAVIAGGPGTGRGTAILLTAHARDKGSARALLQRWRAGSVRLDPATTTTEARPASTTRTLLTQAHLPKHASTTAYTVTTEDSVATAHPKGSCILLLPPR